LATLLVASLSAHAGTKTVKVVTQHRVVVVDKKCAGKYGPGGEVIYMEGKTSRYYYVDKKGHHVYVKKAQLRSHR